jgi:hypothetical protein
VDAKRAAVPPNAEAREDAKRRVLGFLQEMTVPTTAPPAQATDAKKNGMLMDVDSCLSRTSCMGSDRNEPFSTGEIAK